jgi:hypothetical protein
MVGDVISPFRIGIKGIDVKIRVGCLAKDYERILSSIFD